MKTFSKKLLKTLGIIAISILSIFAILLLYIIIQTKVSPNKVPKIFGYKPFIVLSGSMETEIYKGDLVIVKEVDPKGLKENDIIAFREKRESDEYVVTHRIIKIENDGKETRIITKGDNNNTSDEGYVVYNKIEGKYVYKISGLGNVVLKMQEPITLIIVLGLIVVIGVVWITVGNDKLSKEERKELEQLRKNKKK